MIKTNPPQTPPMDASDDHCKRFHPSLIHFGTIKRPHLLRSMYGQVMDGSCEEINIESGESKCEIAMHGLRT
ncbi:MAG: hypothetical protein EMLJLAPB_00877 [Candidatus Argoarchaeum ethanivorans]|uniref:Uncharacterized protein n=1 Tax=Candidatus Argoarchaeum ethanivorans TaxID=2608793 RepID=A0A811TJL9_9EURY|nr:MAG: hypothetical protein EMLJLAPB_00877 [Candidatus Argoarchaeum ethanivorans]